MLGMDLLGLIASMATVVSGLGWVLDRNAKRFQDLQLESTAALTKVIGKMETVEKNLTELRIYLPHHYVTKEELIMHIEGEKVWHASMDQRLEDIRQEISSLRDWRHHSS